MWNEWTDKTIRPASVAGRFYPGDSAALKRTVESLLADAGTTTSETGVRLLIVPHAGYPYSGPTAAAAFATIRGQQPNRVVLLGRSHHFAFEGAAIWPEGAWETPLGRTPVDAAFTAELRRFEGEADPYRVHTPEHALEVELPFLQHVLPQVPIVPVLFGSDPEEGHVQFGRCLATLLSPNDLVVVSTDLSHFLTETEANALDRHTLKTVLGGEPGRLAREARNGSCSLCGATAVVAGMACAETIPARRATLLDYRTSAWATGDTSRVVGYGAISMAA